MRPRVFPAEDSVAVRHEEPVHVASMRPRVFPAEDCEGEFPEMSEQSRFNEAAGIPRGRPATDAPGPLGGIRFNEAAGIPRGRLFGDITTDQTDTASMRPRVFPAEDQQVHRRNGGGKGASMRPRVFPAEDLSVGFGEGSVDEASMRPRVFPAEDIQRPLHASGGQLASMRPRVFPAEDDNRLAQNEQTVNVLQ